MITIICLILFVIAAYFLTHVDTFNIYYAGVVLWFWLSLGGFSVGVLYHLAVGVLS